MFDVSLEVEDGVEGHRRTIARLVEELIVANIERAALHRTVQAQAAIIERLEEDDPEDEDEQVPHLEPVADTPLDG